jgi:hypothetical protein
VHTFKRADRRVNSLLSGVGVSAFDPAAKRRGLARVMLIEKILCELAADPSLIDAVLDDLPP